MFTSKFLSFIRGTRPSIDIKKKLGELNGVISYGEIVRAFFELSRDLSRFEGDLKRSFALTMALLLWLVGLLFYFGGAQLCWLSVGPIIIFAYVEYAEVCGAADNVHAELSGHLALGVSNLLDALTGGQTGFWAQYINGPLEASSTGWLRDVTVLVGLSLAAAGRNGFGLIGLANTCAVEAPKWNAHIANFLVAAACPTRGIFSGWTRWIPMRIRHKLFGGTWSSAQKRSSAIVSACMCAAIGSWFVFTRAGSNRPWGKLKSVATAKQSPDSAEPGANQQWGLGFNPNSTVLTGPVEAPKLNGRVGKAHRTKKGNWYWEYEDEKGQKFIRSLIDDDIFHDTLKDFRQRVGVEGDELEESEFERMYGGQAYDADDRFGKFEGPEVSKSNRAIKQAAKKAKGESRTKPVAKSDPSKKLSFSVGTQVQAVGDKSNGTEESSNTAPLPILVEDGARESALGHCPVKAGDISVGTIQHSDGVRKCMVSVEYGLVVIPTHLGVSNHDLHDWKLYFKGKPYPIKGPIRQMGSDGELTVCRAPDGVKSTTLNKGSLETSSQGVLVTADFKSGELHFSPGFVYKADGLVGRHECSSEPGCCGGLVLSCWGNAPKIVGFHGFGNNGTDTNGYHAVTPELARELKEFKFPKN